jgi:hypothetical protein
MTKIVDRTENETKNVEVETWFAIKIEREPWQQTHIVLTRYECIWLGVVVLPSSYINSSVTTSLS